MSEAMVETCVLTLGELIERNGNHKDLFEDIASKALHPSKEELENSQYKLVIPFYQRAYVWSEKMVKIMLEDIDEQRKEGKKYLLGSLIIHIEIDEAKQDDNKNKENDDKQQNNKQVKFNIVDGQQRLTTLDLVLKCELLDKADDSVVLVSERNTKYKAKAQETIDAWFSNRNKDEFIKYLKENIEFVCVFTNSLDDAFIFFDSANAKGVRLKAYDLIKAFHLRALEDTCKDKIPHYTRFFENLATRQDDLNILINLVLKPAREWIINHQDKQDKNIEETMRIYNEFCKEIPQRFRKDEPYPAHNSLGILQNFMGGADFFEYLKTFDTHYKRMKDFRLYAELNSLKDKGGFDYALKLYLMSSLIYLDKFPNGKVDYMLRLIARAVFSVRVSETQLKYDTTKKYAIRLLPLIYYASYEQELEYHLNDFIEAELANENQSKVKGLFKKEAEYLNIMQDEYENYGITAHISKKETTNE